MAHRLQLLKKGFDLRMSKPKKVNHLTFRRSGEQNVGNKRASN